MSDENPKLFPAWKQAVRTLLDSGLTYGSVLKRTYLSELCEVPKPTDINDVRRYDLEVLRCITEKVKLSPTCISRKGYLSRARIGNGVFLSILYSVVIEPAPSRSRYARAPRLQRETSSVQSTEWHDQIQCHRNH